MAYCLTINSKVCIQETNQWGFMGIPNPHYLYCTYGFILDINSNKMNINKILHIHADWLEDNGYFLKAKECLKQARHYARQSSDERQLEGYSERRRHEKNN